MAKKEKELVNGKDYQFKTDYNSDLDIHDNYIKEFDAYEAMLLGEVYDSVSKSVTKSSITDSYAATLAIERSARVMGKLADGTTEASFKSDAGKAMFMDLMRTKWIYPNANAQRPLFEKLRMWQLYSSVYGYMPMFYDWNVSASGYVGPDCWLWNPRNLIPQQGRTSINDMDYVTALAWVKKSTLEEWLEIGEEGGWDTEVIQELIDMVDDKSDSQDTERQTRTQRTREDDSVKRGICVATRYEAGEKGRWISFLPDYGCKILRDVPNPHKNGRIPFVIKYSQPLYDSFYGMGDFQRAKPLQFARDGLTNFYFNSIKMNLVPPLVANANGVMKHTLDYRSGGVMFETLPNSIRTLNTSNAGLATYQGAQSQLTGSLLSLYGTQNASIPGAEALNPSQGKTPASIKMYSQKEATRDGQERAHLESAIEELMDGFFSLVANIGTEDIPMNLFVTDIEDIVKRGHEDVLNLVYPNGDPTSGTLIFNPEEIRGSEFRFHVTPGSTMEVNKEAQLEQMDRIMNNFSRYQNVIQEDPRIEVNWGAMFKTYEELTSIDGVGDFVKVYTEEEIMAKQQQQMLQQVEMQAQAQAMQAALAPASTTTVRGLQFQDPEIGAAAEQINNL